MSCHVTTKLAPSLIHGWTEGALFCLLLIRSRFLLGRGLLVHSPHLIRSQFRFHFQTPQCRVRLEGEIVITSAAVRE